MDLVNAISKALDDKETALCAFVDIEGTALPLTHS